MICQEECMYNISDTDRERRGCRDTTFWIALVQQYRNDMIDDFHSLFRQYLHIRKIHLPQVRRTLCINHRKDHSTIFNNIIFTVRQCRYFLGFVFLDQLITLLL